MSADNYIFIDKSKKLFKVWACVASRIDPKDINKQKNFLIGKAKTLKEAISLAEKYEKEIESEGSYVEYGISYTLWAK